VLPKPQQIHVLKSSDEVQAFPYDWTPVRRVAATKGFYSKVAGKIAIEERDGKSGTTAGFGNRTVKRLS
jgi:hypothetical protein